MADELLGAPSGARAQGAARTIVVGLLAPPGLPAKLARELTEERLPQLLAERIGAGVDWDVRFREETRAHDAKDDDALADVACETKAREGWDAALSLTDLPFAAGRRPVVADLLADDGVAIVSLPALGAIRRRGRIAELMARLVAVLASERGWLGSEDAWDARGSARRLASYLTPIRETSPDGEDVDVRMVSRPVFGQLRLLGGMLRANRPWRVVLGLSRALVVALSTAAFALVTNTIWQLGEAIGTLRLVIFSIVALTAMVVWLIVVHDLWERPEEELGREQARLFNVVTVLTLVVGALCFYAALYVLNLAAEAFILDRGVVETTVGHPVDFRDYLEIAWFTTSLATIGGTLGSGLEDRLEVREAAYSYHPERRSDGDGARS